MCALERIAGSVMYRIVVLLYTTSILRVVTPPGFGRGGYDYGTKFSKEISEDGAIIRG